MALFSLAIRFGTPILLPDPGRGLSVASERIGGEQTTLGGGRVTQTVAVKRTWTMPYPWLTDTQYDVLLAWLDGRRGVGPFELRGPSITTYAVVNVGDLDKSVPYVGRCTTTLTLREV